MDAFDHRSTPFRLHRGDHGRAAVRLDAAELTDIVYDLQTPMTLLTAGTLKMERGNLGDFLDWWVVLRSLIDGSPVHTAGSIEFRDRNGEPLDLHASFESDDDPEDVAHFLAEAGYLHLSERVHRRGDGSGVGGYRRRSTPLRP